MAFDRIKGCGNLNLVSATRQKSTIEPLNITIPFVVIDSHSKCTLWRYLDVDDIFNLRLTRHRNYKKTIGTTSRTVVTAITLAMNSTTWVLQFILYSGL